MRNPNGSARRALSALAFVVLGLVTLGTGCPFKAEEFQKLCDKASDCADGNECTEDKCTGGVCENPMKSAHATCGSNKDKVCDGEGTCIECVSDNDCIANHPDRPICDLGKKTCVSCFDGVKNGKESDVDCGGPDCGACLGQPCDPTKAQPCGGGGSCATPENVCCTTPCTAKCEACSMDKTGLPNGTCGPIQYGQDPDAECSTLGGCGQSQGRCACEDGVKNGKETDVDCGGGTCPACGGGRTCGSDLDCASDVPACTADHICCTSTCDGTCYACNLAGQCLLQPPGFPDPKCTPASMVCGPGGTANPCSLGKFGAPCTGNSKCLSGSCPAGTCAKGSAGKPCSDGADCLSGTCQNYACL